MLLSHQGYPPSKKQSVFSCFRKNFRHASPKQQYGSQRWRPNYVETSRVIVKIWQTCTPSASHYLLPYNSMMLEPHAAVGTVTASLSCTHHHARSCTRVLVQVYPDSVSSLFFFCIKIIAPLAYQKESTVSSGISDRSSTQQPVSAVTLFAASDGGSVSDCSLSEQHPVNAENLSDGCNTITDSSSPSEPRRGQKRDTANSTAVPVGALPKHRAVDCNTAVNSGCPYNTKNKNNSWFSSSLSRKKPSATLSLSSSRIRTSGILDGLADSGLTVDSASDITCVSLLFFKQHQTLCKARVGTVPPSYMSCL